MSRTELRKYNLDYVDAFAAYRNNPNVSVNGFDKTPNPYTVQDAAELFRKQIEKNPPERFLIFNDNCLNGEIGITPRDDIYRFNADIGYFIAEPFWGKGVASKAVALMTDYAFRSFQLTRLVASVFEYNKASMRVLEKNNFFLECIQKKAVVKNNCFYDNYIYIKVKD
jgi:[ribosomal protein S5]-alanine N-acetyltransferase